MTRGFISAHNHYDDLEPDGTEVSEQVEELQERLTRMEYQNEELQDEIANFDSYNVKMKLTISQMNYLRFILVDKLNFVREHAQTEFDKNDIANLKNILKQMEG